MQWTRKQISMLHLLGLALLVSLSLPAAANAGAVITPVPTFPYPSVMVGEEFPASISLFNNSTGPEAAVGVTVGASNLDFYPACPTIGTTADCPTPEASVFALSATGTSNSLAGSCPPGTWTITETAPGRFRFTPPGAIQLPAFDHCTVEFTATARSLPLADSSPIALGVQTNQMASVDTYSPVSGITVRNSGSGATSVIAAPTDRQDSPAARLKVSEGCKRIARATVTGTEIRRVTFFVDGKRRAVRSSAPFVTTVKAFRLKRGRHRVSAQVDFAASSGRLTSNFQGGFVSCRTRKVRFTG
jgi:hypothetical protein